MKIYAYARVSARDQNLDRQLKAFAEFGVSGNRIYADKKSGKDFERKNYSILLKRLRAGDLLVIKSIDRLGRNYNAIISEWSKIVNTIGAGYPRARYAPFRHADKIQHARGKVYFRHRTAGAFLCRGKRARKLPAPRPSGWESPAAKCRGVRFGRPRTVYSKEFLETVRAFKLKNISLKTALACTGMKQGNFYYHLHQCERLSA